MCYQQRFFRLRSKSKLQAREEMKAHDIERTRTEAQPIHPAPERKTVQPKETERELEEII